MNDKNLLTHPSPHSITAEEYARIVAKQYEPDLDWDNPTEYDLADRGELTETAQKILARLAWAGFVIKRIDDLALDEFDLPATPGENREEQDRHE